MAVSVTCPGCATSYPVTEELLGKTIRCKKCQETFTATAAKNRGQDDRIQTKPSAAKGVYVRTVSVSSTMGPGVGVDTTPYR